MSQTSEKRTKSHKLVRKQPQKASKIMSQTSLNSNWKWKTGEKRHKLVKKVTKAHKLMKKKTQTYKKSHRKW